MVTTVYIIRHGESEGNIKSVFQGHTDGKLTAKGELQLEKLSKRCKDISFDVIYASPLTRTTKTAEAMNKYHNVPIIEEKGLIEIFGGDIEGYTWKEISKIYPDISRVWEESFSKFQAPNGESITDVYRRVSLTITQIVKDNKGKTIGVASHGGAIFLLLAFLGGYTLDNLDTCKYWCQNTGICRVDFNENLKPIIVYFNDIQHILDDPSTRPGELLFE